MYKLALLLVVFCVVFGATTEFIGTGCKGFVFTSQQIATDDAVACDFTGASKYTKLDLTTTSAYTTASVKYLYPNGAVASTNKVTKGTSLVLFGTDAVAIKMTVTRNMQVTGGFLLHN